MKKIGDSLANERNEENNININTSNLKDISENT